jgi:hypothetical protein
MFGATIPNGPTDQCFEALRLRATLERNAAMNRGFRESTIEGG